MFFQTHPPQYKASNHPTGLPKLRCEAPWIRRGQRPSKPTHLFAGSPSFCYCGSHSDARAARTSMETAVKSHRTYRQRPERLVSCSATKPAWRPIPAHGTPCGGGSRPAPSAPSRAMSAMVCQRLQKKRMGVTPMRQRDLLKESVYAASASVSASVSAPSPACASASVIGSDSVAASSVFTGAFCTPSP